MNLEELEKQKLLLEIRELEKPLYLKVSLYAVLIPGVLAIATLFTGFYTGLLDVKEKTLELKEMNFAQEVQKKSNIKETRNITHGKSFEHMIEIQKIIQNEVRQGVIKYLMDRITNNTNTNIHIESINNLIAQLKENPEYINLVESELKKSHNHKASTILIYTIYKTTDDKKWLNKLFSYLSEKPNSPKKGGFSILGDGQWLSDEAIKIIKYIISMAGNLNIRNFSDSLSIFYTASLNRKDLYKQTSKEERLKLIHFSLNAYFDKTIDISNKEYAIRTISWFIPEAYPVLSVNILIDPNYSDSDKLPIIERIYEIREGMGEFKDFVKDRFIKLKFPINLSAEELRKWSKTKIFNYWMEKFNNYKKSKITIHPPPYREGNEPAF